MVCDFTWYADRGAWHWCGLKPDHDGPHRCGYGGGTCDGVFNPETDIPSKHNN